ncbi:MAG: beta-lactamase family protein [Akkermansiaceae bacterium]|jgi:CubicO group peptidase (beta-lactamase class C family)|nr:beta-lactamase family protein [Akkermansiaceae bacterium]
MTRREGIRLMAAAAALGPLPACVTGSAPPAPEDGSGFTIPGAAVDHLRAHARSGFGCWQGRDTIAAVGLRRDFSVLSITKPVAALAAVRAISEGWLAADEAVVFREWGAGRGAAFPTVRQLVDSTAGIKVGVKELYSRRPFDKGAAALALPPEFPPGRVFRYGPAPWEILAELLRRRLADRGSNLNRWFRRHLAAIGVRPRDWRRDGSGVPYFSTGMECGLDDLGRLGGCLCHLLRGESHAGLDGAVLLDLGAAHAANPMFAAGIWWNRAAGWRGAQVIAPEPALKHDRAPGFWRGGCLQPSAHPGWIALVGSGGSRVYVLARPAVVVAVARAGERWSDAAMLHALTSR